MSNEIQPDRAVSDAWQHFNRTIEPLRPDLFRFCLRLTGNPFDAEDLVHDGMLKAFGALGLYRHQIHEPRSYMLRVLSNLWIDTLRRRRLIEYDDEAEEVSSPPTPGTVELEEAASHLLSALDARQQLVVVMKEVFEMSHQEIAAQLGMTEGAVKVALHRARRSLARPAEPPRCNRSVVERFVAVFQTHDMDAVKALLAEEFDANVFPAGAGRGRDFAAEEGWLYGCFYHHIPEREAAREPYPLHLEVHEVAGEPVVLVFRDHGAGNALEEVWRFESGDGVVFSVKDYGFCPDLVRYVAQHVGVPFGKAGYHFGAASYQEGLPGPT